MKCLNCGAELPDGAKFCGNCGAAIPAAAPADEEVNVAAKEATVSAEAEATCDAPTEKAPSKVKLAMAAAGMKLKALAEKAQPVVERFRPFVQKNKLWIAGGACIAVLLITILIVISALTAGNGYIAFEHSIQLLPADDELMLMYDNKKIAKTGIEAGYIEDDQVNLDGTIYVGLTDNGQLVLVKGRKAKVVAEEVTDFELSVNGKGIAFITKNDDGEEILKYLKVGKKKAVTISDSFDGNYVLSPDGKSVSYFKYDEENGESVLMYFNGSKSKKVTSSRVRLIGMSNKGKQIYVTALNDDEQLVLYAYNSKGDKKKLGSCSGDDFRFNDDHTQILFYDDGKTYVSTKGKEAVKISSGNASLVIPESSQTFGSSDVMTYPTDNLYNKVYRCFKDMQYNLWLIKKNVDKNKRLVNNAYSVTLDESAKFVYYRDKDGDLKVLKISHGDRAADKAKLIAEEVSSYVVTSDRKRVYFISEDSLFSVNGKNGRSKKTIASENVGNSLVLNRKDICYYTVDGDVYACSNGRRGKVVLTEASILEASPNGIVYFVNEDTIFATKTAKKPGKIYSME